jgi:Putative beta-barrel porin 2
MINCVPELALIKAWLQPIGKVWRNFGTALPCTALYTALLSLALLLTVMCGLPSAQTPPPGNELAPAPTAPSPLETFPSAPGPLEILPSPQEQLLAPVPQQFNWLEREVPSNPLLESLLNLRESRGLTVTTSLTESGSDNFDHIPGSHRFDSRTGVVLGTVYRLDDGQKFVSLANTIRAFYQARTARSQIGFANFLLNAGYQLPPLSFGLTDSFVRDDNTAQLLDASFALLGTEQKFLRNSISPQVRYDISPTTAATLGYTNTVVVDESGTQGTTTSHAVSPGIQHQFSPNLTSHMRYTFTTSNGSGLSSGSGISGNRSHQITTDLGYQLDTETSAILSAFGTLVDRSTAEGQSTTGVRNSRTYGASLGVRRVLFSTVRLFGSVGPTVFKLQGEKEKLRANWQLSLDAPIAISPLLTLTLTTQQSLMDTVGEVSNVGLVLRQVADARLTYTHSAVLTAALFVQYSRNELLENSDTVEGEQGRIDNLSSAGVTASYALTSVISLTGAYLYQRRDSNQAGNNFDENRITIAVTGRFPIF